MSLRLLVFPLAVFFVLLLVPGKVAAKADSFDIEFLGPSDLEGALKVSCDGAGFSPDPTQATTTVRGTATYVRLETRQTWVNSTIVFPGPNPVEHTTFDAQHVTPQEFRDVPLQIWSDHGGTIFGEPAEDTRDPLRMTSRSSGLTLSAPGRNLPGPISWYYISDDRGRVSAHEVVYPGVTRLMQGEEPTLGSGAARIYLREGNVSIGSLSFELGPYVREIRNVSTPAAIHKTLVLTDAILHLKGAELDLPSMTKVACRSLSGTVAGSFVANRVAGTIERGDEESQLANQALAITGNFAFLDGPVSQDEGTAAVRMEGEGKITAYSVDFVEASAIAPPRPPDPTAVIASSILVVFIAGLLNAGHLVGFFYTRLGKDAVLDNPRRSMVYDSILANPGANLSRLKQLTQLHITTVIYHIQVMKRVGLIRQAAQGRAVRHYALLGQPTPVIMDEKTRFIVDQTRGGPTPLSLLALQVHNNYQISLRAAYQAIERAVRAGAVRKMGSRKRAVVEFAN